MGDCGAGELLSSTQLPGDPLSPSAATEEISVLVTGFGPFKSNTVNASYLIASSLPPSLSLPLDKTISRSQDGTATAARRVAIHVHPSPISVAYSAVRTTIPIILEKYFREHGRHPDIVLHMGIAATRNYYSVETQAHRDAYYMSDNLGRVGYEDGERRWKELSLPPVLKAGRAYDPATGPETQTLVTELDPASSRPKKAQVRLHAQPPNEELLRTWQALAPPNADIRISGDAGRYLCEFIFYTSLSLAFQEGRDRNVVFLHVPSSCREEDVETGRGVAIALIKALVACWVDEKL